MTHLTVEDFEARYRHDRDPWSYTSSEYERDKYAATLRACGIGPFEHALELGASIGVFSALLAPRCRSLVTIDAAPTAATEARRRVAEHVHVEALVGVIPDAIPVGSFDLVVASEILYYLQPDALVGTLAALEHRLAPGGRLVAAHWRPAGPERPFTAERVHDRLRRQPWLDPVASSPTDDYLLDVLERPGRAG